MIAGKVRPLATRGRHTRALLCAVAGLLLGRSAQGAPFVPASDAQVLAELPAGARYTDLVARGVASDRLDVALPLAQFYIRQSRLSGDLRYLGYADAVLDPWLRHRPPVPEMLVLHATVQQSRHEFAAALSTLDLALRARPDDPQALLTRATILRVLGRYPEARAACDRFAAKVDAGLGALCVQSLRGLTGRLPAAYATLAGLPTPGWTDGERSWLYSELGEMAARLGRDAEAERWFDKDLALAPEDFYARAAYADLLLHEARPQQVLQLLEHQESVEPLLLRIAIAQRQLDDPNLRDSRARLAAAFAVELERGEAVHRREQARFLLEVQAQPRPALAAALANWQTQREPQDAEVLVAAAQAAGEPAAGSGARAVLQLAGIDPPAGPVP